MLFIIGSLDHCRRWIGDNPQTAATLIHNEQSALKAVPLPGHRVVYLGTEPIFLCDILWSRGFTLKYAVPAHKPPPVDKQQSLI